MQCRYTEIAQRIFKYSDIQYTSLTLDEILNSLVYRTLFYVNIYGSFKLIKTVRFFWPTLYIHYPHLAISFYFYLFLIWQWFIITRNKKNRTHSFRWKNGADIGFILINYDNQSGEKMEISALCWPVFTVRLHVMQRTVLLSQFCLSVRLSVCPWDACIVTKLNNALRIFWYHTKQQSL